MLFRSVVFIEDETIKDIGKPEKPKTTTPQVVLDPVNPPLVHDNHGGDDNAEDDDAADQGSTSQGHEQPSDEDDDDNHGDDNPHDSPPPV